MGHVSLAIAPVRWTLLSVAFHRFPAFAVNLVFDAEGMHDGLLLVAGSVDQTNNYVFEVIPRGIGESASKSLPYWSTGDGDDTMVTLWNPADEPQDLVFELFFSGGHYAFPVHLDPRATRTFNVSEIVQNQIPDAEGNVVPAGIHEGSAKIRGSRADNELVLIAFDLGIYNVRKATCTGPQCYSCNGATTTFATIVPSAFSVAVGGQTQLKSTVQWNTGTQYDLTSISTWSSSKTSVATVQAGLVKGVSAGSLTASANATTYVYAQQVCSYNGNACPENPIQGNGPGTTTNCPSTVSIAGTTNVPLEDNFPAYLTGIGIFASMQVGPASSAPYNNAEISESLSTNGVMQNTCPAQVFTGQCSSPGGTGTVGIAVSKYGVNMPAATNIFYDLHERDNTTSMLNTANLNTCTYSCNQTYTAVTDPAGNPCGGANIGSFIVTYTFNKSTIQGTAVTRTTVTKQ